MRQHTLAALHRLRSGWLSTHGPARINAVRGILRELGLFIPKGAHFVVPAISELVEDADSDLPDVLRPHLRDACSEIRELKDKCAGIEHELKALAKQLPEVQRLLTIPGIGLLTATAIVGFVGDLRRFPSGRRFSSYLGLVGPKRTPVVTFAASGASPSVATPTSAKRRSSRRADAPCSERPTSARARPTSSAPGRGRSTARGDTTKPRLLSPTNSPG